VNIKIHHLASSVASLPWEKWI